MYIYNKVVNNDNTFIFGGVTCNAYDDPKQLSIIRDQS